MKKDFEDFYYSIDDQELKNVWEETKKEKNKSKTITTIIIIITDIIIVTLFSNTILAIIQSFSKATNSVFGIAYIVPLMFPATFLLIIDFMIYIIIHIIFSKNTSKYNSEYKEKIIDSLLKNFFSEVDYVPKKIMPQSIYNEGKYGMYDIYYSDDYVDALINNKYSIKMAEVKTEEERQVKDSDGKTRTVRTLLFNGLFAKIYLGKSINNEIRISQNVKIKLNSKNVLNMDSQEFEKYFDVTTTDKIVGMQLLTHDVMDLLVNFKKYLQKDFDIYIKDNMMYIRLHVGTLFEAKFNKNNVLDREKLQTYYDIVDFIDMLSRDMIELVKETQI